MKSQAENSSPPLEVSDLPAASFLLTLGGKLSGTRRNEGGRVVFQFTGLDQADLLRFYSGDDRLSARALFAAYRDLKGLVVQVGR